MSVHHMLPRTPLDYSLIHATTLHSTNIRNNSSRKNKKKQKLDPQEQQLFFFFQLQTPHDASQYHDRLYLWFCILMWDTMFTNSVNWTRLLCLTKVYIVGELQVYLCISWGRAKVHSKTVPEDAWGCSAEPCQAWGNQCQRKWTGKQWPEKVDMKNSALRKWTCTTLGTKEAICAVNLFTEDLLWTTDPYSIFT